MANEINVQLGEPHTPRIGLERIMYSPTTIILDPTPATTEQAGVVELATNAETLAGTDTERAVTPSGLHSTKGAAGGFAELDSNGKVPSSQLPSFVDDVVEAYYKTADDRFYEEPSFTTLITPSAGKSWVDIPTNKSYRWTGSVYVRVDEGVQLGETSDTAYRGDRGKVAYEHATDASRNTTAKAKKLYKMSVTEEGHVGQVEESTAEEDIEVLQDDVATLQRGEFPGNTRTLTKDEWIYLLSTRSASTVGSTANARFIKCTVNSIYGLMILPDVFTLPSGITMSSINTPAAVFSTNVYTSAQWEILEDLGCVFLPTTGGRRNGTTLETYSWGAFYMTSTVRTDTEVHKAFHIAFSNGSYNFNEYSSVALGGAVRLATEDNVKGLFSISASTKCNIAKSNLQYHCLNKTWRFAENAYDTIGNGNTNISENYNGWIDLFGYGTSGWNSGVTCYQPWSSSTQESDYIAEDLTGNYKNADWGVFAIKKQLQPVAFSGNYDDLENKPTIPAAQIQSDWNQSDDTQPDFIQHKPQYSSAAWMLSYASTSSTITLNFGISKIPSSTNKVVYIFIRFFSLSSTRDIENNKNVRISFWDDNNDYIVLPLKIAYAPNYDTLYDVKLYQLPEFTGSSGTLILMYDPQNSCVQYLGGVPDFSVSYYNDSQITDFLNLKGGFSVPTRTYYGTCSTAASTATKVLTFSDCRFISGVIIGVLFSNTNTAQNPTLNYDSQAKSIKYNGSILSTSNLDKAGKAGHVIYYMYDGTNWIWMGEDNAFSGSFNDLTDIPDATETQKGVAELATSAEAIAGTDTERIMTPKTVKDAHDSRHWFGTQAEFDALSPNYDANVIYHVEQGYTIPQPTVADAGKLLSVSALGDYELVTIVNSELVEY